ncbi:hypothetical protein Mapa_014500 [Marchantia paleacea]|nr:hypothetical protein Mapa_014500 [Marchantia paleacea]
MQARWWMIIATVQQFEFDHFCREKKIEEPSSLSTSALLLLFPLRSVCSGKKNVRDHRQAHRSPWNHPVSLLSPYLALNLGLHKQTIGSTLVFHPLASPRFSFTWLGTAGRVGSSVSHRSSIVNNKPLREWEPDDRIEGRKDDDENSA